MCMYTRKPKFRSAANETILDFATLLRFVQRRNEERFAVNEIETQFYLVGFGEQTSDFTA